jgi:hypothetical protein
VGADQAKSPCPGTIKNNGFDDRVQEVHLEQDILEVTSKSVFEAGQGNHIPF